MHGNARRFIDHEVNNVWPVYCLQAPFFPTSIMRRISHIIIIAPLLSVAIPVFSITWKSTTPEASSTLLQLHRLYLEQPPHDRSLYDILQISPNATAAAISKKYRELSRKYHPDKQRDVSTKQSSLAQLERIRTAYEILKDDRSRLPYHQYGLMDIRQAVILLTGRHDQGAHDPSLQALLQLMGYPMMPTTAMNHHDHDRYQDYEHHHPLL
jgi:hypothetical protein